MKELLTTEAVIKYFDHSNDVTPQCDASDSGLGAVILQESQPVCSIHFKNTYED